MFPQATWGHFSYGGTEREASAAGCDRSTGRMKSFKNVPVLGGSMIDRKRGFYDEAQETMPQRDRGEFLHGNLRAAVRHAYENAPAARKKMDEAGIKPADVRSVADLAKIPLTPKADLKSIPKAEP